MFVTKGTSLFFSVESSDVNTFSVITDAQIKKFEF